MDFRLKTALLLFFLAGCNATEKKPDIKTDPEAVRDTLENTKKDGVAVEKPILTEKEKMPPALIAALDQTHPGWELPEFSPAWLANFDDSLRNLTWVKGDFDKNKTEDYAIQVLIKDSISVIAFLQQPRSDRFNHFLLERGPLLSNNHKNEPLKSFYSLRFIA